MALQHHGFMCEVTSLSYDFASRSGALTMAPNNCCDMGGCIEVFSKIDPGVQRIMTFAGKEPDTTYVRDAKGKWEALDA